MRPSTELSLGAIYGAIMAKGNKDKSVESRREAYRRIEAEAERRVAAWPAWKQHATQVPIERREPEQS